MRLVVPLLHLSCYVIAIILILFIPLNLLNHLFNPHNLFDYLSYLLSYVALSYILYLGSRQIISRVIAFTHNLLKEKTITVGDVTMHIPLVAGKMHGTAKSFHSDGSLMITMEFENDVPHGNVCVYDENGILRHEGKYVKGLLEGETLDYWADGGLFMRTPYVNGVRSGIAEAYYENGSLITKCKFVNDKIHGQVCFHFDSMVSDKTLHRFLEQNTFLYKTDYSLEKLDTCCDQDASFIDNFDFFRGSSNYQGLHTFNQRAKAFCVDKNIYLHKADTKDIGNTISFLQSHKSSSYDEMLALTERLTDEYPDNGMSLLHDGIYVTYVNGKIQGPVFKMLDGRCRWIMGFENGLISGYFSKFNEQGKPIMKIFPHQGFIYKADGAGLDFAYIGFINGKCSNGIDSDGNIKILSADIAKFVTPYIVDAYSEIFADSLFNFSVFRSNRLLKVKQSRDNIS